MKTVLDDALAIGILVSSIAVTKLTPITAVIKTMAEKDLVLEDVSSRLIEECNALKGSHNRDRAAVASRACGLCKKPGHSIHSWLHLSTNHSGQSLQSKRYKKYSKGQKKCEERAAIAPFSQHPPCGPPPDMILLDSGDTSHMTLLSDPFHSKSFCSVSIKFADDSTVKSVSTGVRDVQWMSTSGRCTVHLSETLVTEVVVLSLISIPALARKNITTLFMPNESFVINLEGNNKVLGQSKRYKDCR